MKYWKSLKDGKEKKGRKEEGAGLLSEL